MLEFDAPQNSFVLYLNDRRLIEAILDLSGAGKLKSAAKLAVIRTLDKWDKLSKVEIEKRLAEIGLDKQSIIILENFMASRSLEEIAAALPDLKDNAGFKELAAALDSLRGLGYGELIEFNPTVIRGFDYYDGLVFEIFGQENKKQAAGGEKEPWKRALFGGGRYNGLAEIFGAKNFPAVGFAPGDETTRLFLEDWNLLGKVKDNQPAKYYLPLLAEKLVGETTALVRKLRAQGKNILSGLEEQKIGKALEFANKKNISQVIIFGSDEAKRGIYKIKDMKSGEEKICKV
jgi:histidyl-tRNA synthetase